LNVAFLNVFVGPEGRGGNPAHLVLDADGMSDAEMRGFAASVGHECGFVLPPDAPNVDFRMRYFVPAHEMEMCGHATVGALCALRNAGLWKSASATISTQSGPVRGFVRDGDAIEITQPRGQLEVVANDDVGEILRTLGLPREALLPMPILNARTSRTKTLVPLKDIATLDGLQPDFARMKATCERIDSTGLYPFAVESREQRIFHARQFPRASGYPEDPATGIAAAALLYGLRRYELIPADPGAATIHQGRAMGSPSTIHVRFELAPSGQEAGCFVGGKVVRAGGGE